MSEAPALNERYKLLEGNLRGSVLVKIHPSLCNADSVGMQPNWGEIRLLSFLRVMTAAGTYSCIVQMCGIDRLFYDYVFYSLFPLNFVQHSNIWAVFLGAS